MRAYFKPGVDPENFDEGMQFWFRLNVCYYKYENGRRLDAKKGAIMPFENASCLRLNQKFF